jgi:LmbE family N-acetylglucosaminyl deacetylase
MEQVNIVMTEQQLRAVVVPRPHYRLAGDELYFLVSNRSAARLSAEELAIWRSLGSGCDGERIRVAFGEAADKVIQGLIQRRFCDVVIAQFPRERRRVLVVEPHSDDAALSVGGTMWSMRNKCEFTIATIASRSNFTSYFYTLDREYFSVEAISRLRAAEGTLVARMLGGQYIAIGEAEATIRYRDTDWSLASFRKHQASVRARTGRAYAPSELERWTHLLRELLVDPRYTEVWLPLGVGPHCDHQLTRDAAFRALLDDSSLLRSKPVKFYEEVPYAARNPGYTQSLVGALADSGAKLDPKVVPIADVFEQKLRMISVYGSQLKLKALQEDIELSAHLAAGGEGLAERFWTLRSLPSKLDLPSLRVDHSALHASALSINRWIARHQSAHQVRVLLLVPSGRWESDLFELCGRLPNAHFELYHSAAGSAEVDDLSSTRITTHRVDNGMKAWLALSAKLAVARSMPTLFISGQRRLGAARKLGMLWPLSSTLVLPSLDYLFLTTSQNQLHQNADAVAVAHHHP